MNTLESSEKILEKYTKNKEITNEIITPEGHIIRSYGKPNMDKLIDLLLNSRYINE